MDEKWEVPPCYSCTIVHCTIIVSIPWCVQQVVKCVCVCVFNRPPGSAKSILRARTVLVSSIHSSMHTSYLLCVMHTNTTRVASTTSMHDPLMDPRRIARTGALHTLYPVWLTFQENSVSHWSVNESTGIPLRSQLSTIPPIKQQQQHIDLWPRCTHPENLDGIMKSWQRRRDPGGRLSTHTYVNAY